MQQSESAKKSEASHPRAAALTRRQVLGASLATGLATPAIAQETRSRTLRFVPSANLSFLDPLSTTGVTAVHSFAVFDQLYGLDNQLRPQPQMAEGHTVSDDQRVWTFRLREGLLFHDGEKVRATDCIASIARWGRRDSFGGALLAATDRMEVVDDRTFRIHLKWPMAPLLDALAHSVVIPLFIMPERLALTDPLKQVTEIIGSGPYRFLPQDYVSGSRVAYSRFDRYVPREGPPAWTSGGKRAFFDRLEWSIIPDPATAAAALRSGELDWWELILADLAPSLARDPKLVVQDSNPYGLATVLGFNFLNPPFNNPAVRRVVRDAIDQIDTVQAIVGTDPTTYRSCRAMFGCGLPGVIEPGQQDKPLSLIAGKQALREAGYAGEKVVILDPTDYSFLSSGSRIAADLLSRLGMNVDLQSMDFGTLIQRRNSKEPVERGGWSIFCTGADVVSLSSPGLNYYIRGNGTWAGWYQNAEIERLAGEWLRAPDAPRQQERFEQIQRLSWQDVPMVPLGQFKSRAAFRRDLTGVLPSSSSLFWNVRRG